MKSLTAKHGWAEIPSAADTAADRRLGELELRVLLMVAAMEGYQHPAISGVAEALGATGEGVAAAVRRLEGFGYLEARDLEGWPRGDRTIFYTLEDLRGASAEGGRT